MTQRLIDPRPSAPGLAGRALLRGLGVHPHDREGETLDLAGRRALCIATNHGVLDVGVPTGLYASELTAPYYRFLDAGMEVDVASPKGGIVPIEPLSMKEPLRSQDDDRMLADDALRAKLMGSLAIGALDFASYDLVYLAGGWGAAYDFGQSELLGEKVSEAVAAGRVLGGVCHGPLGLLRARRPDGEPFGHAFVHVAVGERGQVGPVLLEDAARQQDGGAVAIQGLDFWRGHFGDAIDVGTRGEH